MSEQFTNLERAVLEMMLAGDHPKLELLRQQFSEASVSQRKYTGHGFFTDLDIPVTIPRLHRKYRITIQDVAAELPQLKHGAGFILFVDDGAMKLLEGFCYDESWPDSIESFTLSYLQESPRGSGRLIPSAKRDAGFAFKSIEAKD